MPKVLTKPVKCVLVKALGRFEPEWVVIVVREDNSKFWWEEQGEKKAYASLEAGMDALARCVEWHRQPDVGSSYEIVETRLI